MRSKPNNITPVRTRSRHQSDSWHSYAFVLSVWISFAILTSMFYCMAAPPGTDVSRHWVTALSSATFFTMPLLWCPPRQRWTLWAALATLTLYIEVTLVYQRNFSTLMPLNSVFQLKNVDGMVWDSAFATCHMADLWLTAPAAMLAALWIRFFRPYMRGKALGHTFARRATIVGCAIWLAAQSWATLAYTSENPYTEAESGFVHDMTAKFRGKIMHRTDYLYHNGLDVYLAWSTGDFFPGIRLDKTDRRLIDSFMRRQHLMDKESGFMTTLPDSTDTGSRRNLLIIMVESLENWPLEYKIGGKPCLPLLDSLTKSPGTLYFPHLVSQASVGHSSDGHLICLTGLLPLRELAAVTDFYDNEYPSLIKAFKEKYGGHAYEIISDDPTMWNQSDTYVRYGFDKLYDRDDIDPARKSGWTGRDRYLADFTAGFLSKAETPFAVMAVTLSLHTPYRSTISGYQEIDAADIDPQSKHYLKICRMDEAYICQILDTLKKRGIYEQTTVVITGDHNAHSLFDNVRPPEISGQEKFIPLIVLNSGHGTRTYPMPAGQIDIYPTLLDILGLHDYRWRGVGLSLLRHAPGGATRRDGDIYGNPARDERERQKTAWDVSDLMIRSNYLRTK